MKKAKTMFWISTIIIFLFEGVLTAISYDSEMSKEAFRHLGYPIYFMNMLTVFKVLGALALVVPKVSSWLKEWAYAGFTFDFIAAFVSIVVVDGFGAPAIIPVVALLILLISYKNYHKLHSSVV